MLSITLDSIIFPHRRSNVYLRQTGYGSPCSWEMRVDDVWDDCVTSLSVSCHEIGVGRRKELYLAHILGHYLFVVVNAWCNSSSRSKWMYYIEGTKMVLVCCSGSSKPEKMYLEQACSSRAEKVSCVLLQFLGLRDDSDFGCLNLLAGISWRCCVERCPFPHQVILDWWEVKFVWYLYNILNSRAMDGKTFITFDHVCKEGRVKRSFCWATRFVGLGLCWTVSLCLVGKSKVQFSVL